MSDDDLTWAVKASTAQIALRWMVLQWEPHRFDRSSDPLELQIVNFSADALAEMCAAYPTLRNAPEELRWLTYFKGLISADTHPRDQMLTAIDAVRRRQADPTVKLSTKSVLEQEKRGTIRNQSHSASGCFSGHRTGFEQGQ